MIYGFQCDTCGTLHEIECPIDERDSQDCPECGLKIDRVFGYGVAVLPYRNWDAWHASLGVDVLPNRERKYWPAGSGESARLGFRKKLA